MPLNSHTYDGTAQVDFDFHTALCSCGWHGPPCPDTGTAVDSWGDHLQEERT